MKETLIVLATIIFGFALRSCKTTVLRKLGALVMLIASAMCVFFISDSILMGVFAASAWFILPWVELMTRIRKLRMPITNTLQQRFSVNLAAFPDAQTHIRTLENEGFEHIRNAGWNLGGMDQLFQLYWNAETKAVAALCLCEQSHITFSYLTITSRDLKNGVWRTTNFPFSPNLKLSPKVHWNQISCVNECAKKVIEKHSSFLLKNGFCNDTLSIPDPDHIEQEIESELNKQINHNLKAGIITAADEVHFRYTPKGLFFLWCQSIKDMIRLC